MSIFTFRLNTAFAISVLFLSGCAGLKQSSENAQQPLWQAYQSLAKELKNDGTFSRYDAYISETLINIITENSQADHNELIKQVAVPLWFDTVLTHIEGAEHGNQCLVTNGLSTAGDYISAATEYQREDERFKIRAVEIRFLENGSEFPRDIWCPVRPEAFM